MQTCSEMVIPVGRGSNDTMFQAAPFDAKKFSKECKESYGVYPRPNWVTTYYGGHVSTFFFLQYIFIYILMLSCMYHCCLKMGFFHAAGYKIDPKKIC